MEGSRQHRSQSTAEMLFPSHAGRSHPGSVVRIPKRNRLEFTGYMFCQHDRHFNGFGSTGAEKRPAQIAGGDLCQFFSQIDRRNIRIPAGAKRHFVVQLLLDSRNDFRIVKAGVMDAVAVHVDVFVTVQIFDINTLRPGKNIYHGSRKALVQKITGIFLKPLFGRSG